MAKSPEVYLGHPDPEVRDLAWEVWQKSVAFNRLQRSVRALASRYQISCEAEDILQETLLILFGKLTGQEYDPTRASLETYGTGIAYKLAYKILREIKRTQSLSITTRQGEIGQPGEDALVDKLGVNPEAWCVTQSTIETIIEQIDINARDWSVLLLFHGYGLKSKEIAAELGISDSNVRVILHRTRRQLKAIPPEYVI